jgi:molybdopterin-synthase adenylyltransferase
VSQTETSTDKVDYRRQALIANPRLLSAIPVHIVGMGTVGSNAAYHLARLGIKNFTIYDADRVEAHNIPSQQFDHADIGNLKVEAAYRQILRSAPDASVDVVAEFADGTEQMEGIVILGLDSMDARREVFAMACEYQPQVKRVIDIRMAGNTAQAFTINPCDPEAVAAYKLFDFNNDLAAELPCGGESVSYVGPWSGVLAANLVRQHAMEEDVPFSVTVDFGSWTFKFPKFKKG